MREIPSLQTLCLRSVGGKDCSAEDTFATTKEQQPSVASRLLRSYQLRLKASESEMEVDSNDNAIKTALNVPMSRIPSIGKGSARRKQANDLDLNHPWIAVRHHAQLVGEYNTPGLDVLQAYIDSLVELSRMDDARLGLHFFQEWKANVQAKEGVDAIDPPLPPRSETAEQENTKGNDADPPPTKKVRRSSSPSSQQISTSKPKNPPLGALSLHNSIIQMDTIEAMVESGMTYHLAVLDLTGVQTLNDDMLGQLITKAPHLKRLSLKNCRRLTAKSLETIAESSSQLTALDLGGSYNLYPSQVLETVAALFQLVELHVSGLQWTDDLLMDVTSLRSWRALSLGYLFPRLVTQVGLKQALTSQSASLESLALPFCEHLVDAPLLGTLGRHLPNLKALDVRGNSNLNSLTGWYDGRATLSPVPPPQPLLVLGRYSGLAKANIEDTKRIHPHQAMNLVCHLDSGGVGEGIQRTL